MTKGGSVREQIPGEFGPFVPKTKQIGYSRAKGLMRVMDGLADTMKLAKVEKLGPKGCRGRKWHWHRWREKYDYPGRSWSGVEIGVKNQILN